MNSHQIPGEGAADRYEWGRSVRERISLESHAELCNPGSRDPVGLIQGQEANMKGSADVESFTPSELRRYATACGWTLAHAHCRTGSASAISGYLGDDDTFDRAIAEFGVAYADLAEADYAAFKSAV